MDQMSSFVNAMVNPNITYTENGDITYKTSGSLFVDLFGKVGSSRGVNLKDKWVAALNQDPLFACRLALWTRDVRSGAGERQQYRDFLCILEEKAPHLLVPMILKTPEVGRWDDLLVFKNKETRNMVYLYIAYELKEEKNGLCAKWMPRKGPIARELADALGLTSKEYRRLIVDLTNVVETKMCKKEWGNIDYNKVPSLASIRYNKAFTKNDASRYAKWKNGLVTGVSKVNAGAVYPYQVLELLSTDETLAEAQWKALPNYLGEGGFSAIPMADVSESMNAGIAGSATSCMNVGLSLSMYLAERNKGPFQDFVITFTDVPEMYKLTGSLKTRNCDLKRYKGYNTNIDGAFTALLAYAKASSVKDEDMPKNIIIFSDMQFDLGGGAPLSKRVRQAYKNEGYSVPTLIYWNLNGHITQNQSPVQSKEKGTVFVSGFSPALMKSLFTGNEYACPTPEEKMLEVLLNERYNFVRGE